jgi:hypothetical protein
MAKRKWDEANLDLAKGFLFEDEFDEFKRERGME